MELLISAYEKILNTNRKQTKGELLEALEGIRVDIMGFMESTPIRDHVMSLCEKVEAPDVTTAIALKLAGRLDFADGKEAPNLSKELRVVISELGEADDDDEMGAIFELMNETPNADAG